MKKKRYNRYGVDMRESNAYYEKWDSYRECGVYTLKRDYRECGCRKDEDCCCDEDLSWDDLESPSTPTSNRRLLLTLR